MCALIPAAGRGVRFGSNENKVFAPLLGSPLLAWTLEAFARCDAVDSLILIGSEADLPRLREIGERHGGGKLRAVIPGGDDRQASVRNGLAVLPEDTKYVVVHDGARPCVTPEIIDRVLQATRCICGAATAAIPISDTLIREHAHPHRRFPFNNGEIGWVEKQVPRDGLWAVQTPQAFRVDTLRYAHEQSLKSGFQGTDDFGLVHHCLADDVARGYFVTGSPENLKVTRPEDLALAEAILARRGTPPPFPLPSEGEGVLPNRLRVNSAASSPRPAVELLRNPAANSPFPSEGRGKGGGVPFRIGYGYDVHPFADGRPLYLGGVHFPEASRGLQGHSDADVLLHAICDALLGAAGMGDIGTFFPPSDMRHKDRRSTEFLAEVGERIGAAGWTVGNIDAMVLAETPKIGPRVEQIRRVIAEALGASPETIGIKATTNEGLGFVGRGEGIAVHATALLMRREPGTGTAM